MSNSPIDRAALADALEAFAEQSGVRLANQLAKVLRSKTKGGRPPKDVAIYLSLCAADSDQRFAVGKVCRSLHRDNPRAAASLARLLRRRRAELAAALEVGGIPLPED